MSPSHTNEGDRGYVALPSANETPAFGGVSVKGEIYRYGRPINPMKAE